MSEEILVTVRRQMKDWRVAKFRPVDLANLRWEKVRGQTKGPAPAPLLTAQVSCEAIVEGELSHTGSYGPCPHEIKVHIAKNENDPGLYAQLAAQAGKRP